LFAFYTKKIRLCLTGTNTNSRYHLAFDAHASHSESNLKSLNHGNGWYPAQPTGQCLSVSSSQDVFITTSCFLAPTESSL